VDCVNLSCLKSGYSICTFITSSPIVRFDLEKVYRVWPIANSLNEEDIPLYMVAVKFGAKLVFPELVQR